ncbi:short-chain dehydrogenase/reductase family 42E member 1-like [Penaeus japonicus]|uniref:short-chain dehydrogenase/reductase family 42E member 1-like n=1 Tax=Penaeus japonicus TaxID=27405 RepID=UPI001C712134|nr:short-chain dehydrogenase/reductase family 42E member 1-like [Penaeus japonicus]XP_042864510.1 short-chain dehydrogenase/reductase family 42E member 1-like [Penaeus japonicus]XP_042864519.1 short-chain dehydrogenase/reductase family 42E member 1-like [Penaeus japonicus]
MKVVVTGGGGYVGYHVGWVIARGGHEVTLLDIAAPDPEWATTAPEALRDALPDGFWPGEVKQGSLEHVECDVTDLTSLTRLMKGAAAVIHTASYGVSGKEQLSPHFDKQEKVNVEGTRAVLSAALATGVRALVYTSTYNVVFGGKEVRAGDESAPIYPLHAHADHYSRTKAIAEMLVLMANGRRNVAGASSSSSSSEDPSASSATLLRTCSLRLNGVMGLGERRHSRRVIDAFRSSLLIFTYGRKDAIVDFVGIQNVVQAHVKAMMSLLGEQTLVPCQTSPGPSSVPCDPLSPPCSPSTVSGHAFFISDGKPVNHFEYFRPWFEGLGYDFPAMNLPFVFILVFAYLQEFVYRGVHRVFPFTPFVTPAEAYKSGIAHYFSCKKAEAMFGYTPTRPNDQTQAVEYYVRKGFSKSKSAGLSTLFVLLMAVLCLLVGVVLFMCC